MTRPTLRRLSLGDRSGGTTGLSRGGEDKTSPSSVKKNFTLTRRMRSTSQGSQEGPIGL